MSFILGTAGHIDHGKTALVRALTGIDCDRLEEEKKRGITIELGFAWLDLPDGQRLGIVDVPGHERFVKNMVAGAAGIDLVLLVIAADEGVMPQTREHLDICTLLGVKQGLVALTKRDLVDDEWLALVQEDLSGWLAGTFLENAPVIPVSSTTGEGLDELKKAIQNAVKSLEARPRSDIFRLPVDRVFSLRGFGTIVTGTVISGTIRKDTDVVVMPRGVEAHVRTLQRHETPTEEAHPGERCAANLQGVEVADIHRGDVVARPGTLLASKRWMVALDCLATSPMVLRNRTELHFHHGTQEIQARVVFFDRTQLKPGESTLAELRFEEGQAGVLGDHCVLRSSSPLRAVAGGMLVSPLPPLIRARDPERAKKLETLASLAPLHEDGRPEACAELLAKVLYLRGIEGAPYAVLRVLTGLSQKRLDAAIQALSGKHGAVCFDREAKAWIDAGAFARLCEQALARAKELHEKDPLSNGFARTALVAGWAKNLSPKLAARVLEALVADGRLVAAGERLKLPGHEVTLDKRQIQLSKAILAIYEKARLEPPNLKDVYAEVRTNEKEAAPVFKVLVARGDLVRMRDGIHFCASAFEVVVEKVSNWFKDHDDLTINDLKSLLGLSRKYLIALLEYLDQEKITVRIGDKRQFRSR